MLECFLEGLRDVIVTEASKAERSGDFAVLLSHGLSGSEESAKGIEADEEVLLRHDLMDEEGGVESEESKGRVE